MVIDPDTPEPVQQPIERLFRAYDQPVRENLRRRYPHAEAQVDDAMTVAWLRAARRPHTIDWSSAQGWLYTVAQHELWTTFKRERRMVPLEGETLEAIGPRDHPIDRLIDRLDAHELAETTMARLLFNQQRVLFAQSLGLSYRQIAEACGVSETHDNRHITEGRARARKAA